MDAQAKKKALYRAKLKEASQKREKRIDSPLVRYNESDQPVCRVCDVVLKSESLWPAHQASRKHHEAIKNVKATAAGKTQVNGAKSEPPSESTSRSRSSSTLPVGFFDTQDTKRQKTGLGTQENIESSSPKASAKSVDSVSSANIHGKTEGSALIQSTEPFDSKNLAVGSSNVDATRGSEGKLSSQLKVRQVKGALPEGFFDKKDADTTKNMGSAVKQVKGAIPEDFFDKKDGNTTKKMGGSEVKQVKGALPEGFFDNKDADLRARGIEPVKIDIKDEYKEFEKLIQEDLHEVDERLEEEEIDAAEVREEEETLEQKSCRERVEIFKKMQMELKAARFGGKKGAAMGKDSSDEDSSSDEDDNEEDFAVDWRAKNL